MNFKKAYLLVKKFTKNEKVIKCCEYDSLFVFQTAPQGYGVSDSDIILDHLVSVDKKTGQVKTFMPRDIPIDEYNRGTLLPFHD